MAFTFVLPIASDLHELRVIIGDTTENDGPTPGMGNLADALLEHWLDVADDINGAAAMAFDHLAALWVSRPIFGPGELSTIHTNMAPHYRKLADEYRARSADPDVSAGVVRVGSFTKTDGYSSSGSEYT